MPISYFEALLVFVSQEMISKSKEPDDEQSETYFRCSGTVSISHVIYGLLVKLCAKSMGQIVIYFKGLL